MMPYIADNIPDYDPHDLLYYNVENIMEHIPEHIFQNIPEEAREYIREIFKQAIIQGRFYVEEGTYKCSLCGRKLEKLDEKYCTPKKKSAIKIISIIALSVLAIGATIAAFSRYSSRAEVKAAEISRIPETTFVRDPCELNPTLKDVQYSGYCTDEQISSAFETHRKLVEENDKILKDEARNNAKKAFESIDKIRRNEKEENDEFIRKIDFPNEEEKEELRRKVDAEMNKKFKRWAGYIPRNSAGETERSECPVDAGSIDSYKGLGLALLFNKPGINPYCKAHAQIILDIPRESNETEIKRKYRALALEFHPDKYKGENADSIFSMIQTSYETLNLANPIPITA